MPGGCVLALDLGTTAFKAAPADPNGTLAPPTVVPYTLDYAPDGGVTCDPERYARCALRALRGAARAAAARGLSVRAIGLSSQAQTFIPVDARGKPVAPAVVWTDARAVNEAEEARRALPEFAATSGFRQPSPQQILPKLMRIRREDGSAAKAARYLLLNEWIALRLTGEAYGDETNQGMGGFYEITRRAWSVPALSLAGLSPERLARVAPAAAYAAPLDRRACRDLGLLSIPVYSCGNDQSCAAVGAGVERAGDALCNFGTALVVYTLRDAPAVPAAPDQIAGISPLPNRWFLLGLESECGNVIEWLAKLLYPRAGVGRMIRAALQADVDPAVLPRFVPRGGGRLDIGRLSVDTRPEEMARALLEHYAARFSEVLAGVAESGAPPGRLYAAGGLSRSDAWLDLLGRRIGRELVRTPGEHPGLAGISRVIENAEQEPSWNTGLNTCPPSS